MSSVSPNVIHALDAQLYTEFISKMKCRVCNTNMGLGKALEPDSPSLRPQQRGQCYRPMSDGSMIHVLKCPSCGHSVTLES